MAVGYQGAQACDLQKEKGKQSPTVYKVVPVCNLGTRVVSDLCCAIQEARRRGKRSEWQAARLLSTHHQVSLSESEPRAPTDLMLHRTDLAMSGERMKHLTWSHGKALQH